MTNLNGMTAQQITDEINAGRVSNSDAAKFLRERAATLAAKGRALRWPSLQLLAKLEGKTGEKRSEITSALALPAVAAREPRPSQRKTRRVVRKAQRAVATVDSLAKQMAELIGSMPAKERAAQAAQAFARVGKILG